MPRWKKLLIALGAPLLFFGLFELALRLARFEFALAEAPILIWNPVDDRQMSEGAGLHESDPVQLWKPRPGAETDAAFTGNRGRSAKAEAEVQPETKP